MTEPGPASSPLLRITVVSYQGRIGPRLAVFFVCLYFAGLRPGEAVELPDEVNLDLPGDDGW